MQIDFCFFLSNLNAFNYFSCLIALVITSRIEVSFFILLIFCISFSRKTKLIDIGINSHIDIPKENSVRNLLTQLWMLKHPMIRHL